jgi:hypothetical protein
MKSAEFVEQRVLAERNTSQPPVTGTQSLEGTESVLTRKAAPGVDNTSWILDADIQGFFDNLDHDFRLCANI